MADNPLATRQAKPTEPHPMTRHAQMWQHVGKMSPDDLPGHIDRIDYILPLLGALAGNPKVKAKDVIRAAADAAGSGKVSPKDAVKFISGMPIDPEKLQGWLKGLYAANLSAAVHMKAAAMQGAQAQAEPSQPVIPGGLPVER